MIIPQEDIDKVAEEDVSHLSGCCSKFDARDAFKHGAEWAEEEVGRRVSNLLHSLRLDFEHYIKYIDDSEALNLDNFEGDLHLINEFLKIIED